GGCLMRLLPQFLVLVLLVGTSACAPQTPTLTPTRTLAPLPRTPFPPTETPHPIASPLSPEPSVTPVITATSVPATLVLPTAPPTQVTMGDVPAMERRLFETPILLNMATERSRQLFAQGRALGNRADVFTTIGDSNTASGDFLQPIGMDADAYCNWGDYAYLRETVDYFSAAPSETSRNSFTHRSVTAQVGFSSAAVLDPFWASAEVCRAGESPLTCEYRSVQPSIAVIMLGGIDVSSLTTAEYGTNVRRIVGESMARGVIPVLTTFVVVPQREVYERSLEFNMALLDTAEAEQIPLINLWAAAQTLPDEGIGPDHTHLKAQVGSFCSFDGAQQRLGGTLRNLLTLQALDALRQNVLAQ
ncbi:MAG: SGNH/GDSL hydrolase family protein, partial [Chloroflexota bacterium]